MTAPTPLAQMLTVREAADWLGIPVGRLYRAIHRGQVRVVRNRHNAKAPGKAYLLSTAEVERLARRLAS
jgi:excisionase family DNA binding protein